MSLPSWSETPTKQVTKFLSGVGTAWADVTPEAYESEVRDFVARYRDERFGKRCTEQVYQPMLELFDVLRAHDWRDVDIEMLEVADFAFVIVHDDADREYAATSGAERILDIAADKK